MLDTLNRFSEGQGEEGDLEMLEDLSTTVQVASLCGLGKSAPNPVVSTLRYFRDEYVAHIKDKKCPAGVCKALIQYTILEDLCTGCVVCLRRCPQDAISGEKKQLHVIDQELCIQCGICYDVCKFDAVMVT
jgi:Na+-translocating ferredoxin:NAD+ oxidoreductase RNF subunit RnfB